jgi:hypothetical protein
LEHDRDAAAQHVRAFLYQPGVDSDFSAYGFAPDEVQRCSNTPCQLLGTSGNIKKITISM